MKVAFEARALQKQSGGVRTYVEHLLNELQQSRKIDVHVPDVSLAHEALLPVWLNWQLPVAVKKLKPDVVHYTKAAIPARKIAPTIATVYDIIPILFPASQQPWARLLWPSILRHATQQSDHIITISEASKRDIVEHLQVAPEKVTVTTLAVPPGFAPALQVEGKPYVLFVSTIEPRKNVPALIRAFAKIAADIPHTLVIAGRAYKGLDEVLNEVVKHQLEERVEIKDFVPEEELSKLYANADLFVLPSLYEGWSFPAQEAMASGVPVIVSDGGALPEVVGRPWAGSGQAAAIVVPFSTDNLPERQNDSIFEVSLGQAILSILQDETQQTKLRETGLQQVGQRSWKNVSEETIAAYEKVYAD